MWVAGWKNTTSLVLERENLICKKIIDNILYIYIICI